MAREYVPIYFDWLDVTQDLTPEEKGNLIDAVVAYASGEPYDHLLTGGCRIAFRFLRGQVDRNAAISDTRSKARSTEQTATNENKTEQTATNKNKTEQTQSNLPKEKEKEKEKDKDIESINARAHAREERFEKFWAAYPRHEGKQAAIKAWNKINPDDALLDRILTAITRQRASPQWSDAQYIPHAATWINGRRWEDEALPASHPRPRPVVAQMYEQREYADEPANGLDDWMLDSIRGKQKRGEALEDWERDALAKEASA